MQVISLYLLAKIVKTFDTSGHRVGVLCPNPPFLFPVPIAAWRALIVLRGIRFAVGRGPLSVGDDENNMVAAASVHKHAGGPPTT